MDANYKKMTEFLVGMGTEKVPHTNKTYLAHVVAVYRLMEAQGLSGELCRAGMFHSIYGTELFQDFKLPLERRGEIQELIGKRAEWLAYLNCAMDRASFDTAVRQTDPPYRFRDRLTGEEITLSRSDFDDLCRIHLYDWLEQAPRSRHGWDYRRTAYQGMAERLGPAAVAHFESVFAASGAAAH